MKTRDPVRLAELGGDAQPELAAALRALRGRRGSAAQVQALAARLTPELAAPAAAGSAALLPLWAKWLLGGLVSAGLLSLAIASRERIEPRAAPQPAAPAARPAEEPVAVAGPPAIQATAAPAAAIDGAAGAAARAPAPEIARAAPRRRAPASTTAAPRSPELELALVQRSQAALDRDPTAALALAEDHARDYPAGLFAQEREVLAIEALLKLRRRQPAIERAQRFVQRYPESAHARRVRALLERSHSHTTGAATIDAASVHSKEEVQNGGEHAED